MSVQWISNSSESIKTIFFHKLKYLLDLTVRFFAHPVNQGAKEVNQFCIIVVDAEV